MCLKTMKKNTLQIITLAILFAAIAISINNEIKLRNLENRINRDFLSAGDTIKFEIGKTYYFKEDGWYVCDDTLYVDSIYSYDKMFVHPELDSVVYIYNYLPPVNSEEFLPGEITFQVNQ